GCWHNMPATKAARAPSSSSVILGARAASWYSDGAKLGESDPGSLHFAMKPTTEVVPRIRKLLAGYRSGFPASCVHVPRSCPEVLFERASCSHSSLRGLEACTQRP